MIIISILSVSTASLFIRFAQQEAPSLVIASIRLSFASLLIAPFAIKMHRSEISTLVTQEFHYVFLSGLFLAIHFSSWISSLEYTSVTSSVVLVSTGPFWVAIISPIYLKEKISGPIFLGLIITFLGGMVLALSDICSFQSRLVCPSFISVINGKSILGDFLAILGAISVSGYLIIGRKLRTKISLIPYIFVVYSIAAFLLIIIMSLAGQTPFGYSFQTYIWLFLLALFPQIIGHSTYNWLLKILPTTVVAILTLGEPIGATILAFLVLNEKPGLINLGGAFFILIGIFLALRSQNIQLD